MKLFNKNLELTHISVIKNYYQSCQRAQVAGDAIYKSGINDLNLCNKKRPKVLYFAMLYLRFVHIFFGENDDRVRLNCFHLRLASNIWKTP